MENDRYILKNGERLRLGYTTGSCAAAASKAAAAMLLSGEDIHTVHLKTPAGVSFLLDVLDIHRDAGGVSCAIQKDGGDDPDITSGLYIYSWIELRPEPGIIIEGGEGVGTVTKPGLDRPVGEPAINSVPLKMMTDALSEVSSQYGYSGGLRAVIRVPGGAETAKKTFNPRLGIQGGISILGTTGVVEPMSDKAITDTLEIEMRQQRLAGRKTLLLMPGNYGAEFLASHLGIDAGHGIKCSNFIGDSLDLARSMGFSGVLLTGHIGKLIKLAGGIMNTHSRYGDCRSELLMAWSAFAGADQTLVAQIAAAVTTEEMLVVLAEAGYLAPVMDLVLEKIHFHMDGRCHGELPVGAILFSKAMGTLGYTKKAEMLLAAIKKEIKI